MKKGTLFGCFMFSMVALVLIDASMASPVKAQDIPTSFECKLNYVGWSDVYVCEEP